MKERVTLTIEQSVLRQVDARIDGNTVRNRSHAVEMLIREALRGEVPETAVILAGAQQQQIDRVLKEHNNKTMIRHNIDLLTNAGVQEIILISKDPQQIKERLTNIDANIRYVTETEPLGTAGALGLASPYINSTFLVLNADDYKELNIREFYTYHNTHPGMCSIALTTTAEPEDYGVALLNGNKIITFVEKPKDPAPSNLISAGCYLMEKDVLELIPEGYASLETDLFPKLSNNDNLYGYPFSGEYKHI